MRCLMYFISTTFRIILAQTGIVNIYHQRLCAQCVYIIYNQYKYIYILYTLPRFIVALNFYIILLYINIYIIYISKRARNNIIIVAVYISYWQRAAIDTACLYNIILSKTWCK